jgi:hypothetical protein
MLLTAQSDVTTNHYTENIDLVENKLNSEFISELIYSRDKPAELDKWKEKLRNFMAGYKYPADVERIVWLATKSNSQTEDIRLLLELYVRKIGAFLKEDYKAVGELKKEIESHENRIFLPNS